MHPVKGFPITQRYGEAIDYYGPQGYLLGHPGVDFGCPEGTQVKAVVDGVVEHAGPHPAWPGRGIYVVLQHAGGLRTYYLHLSERTAIPGMPVAVGDVIGLSGNTGLSTGPHLHFGVCDLAQEDNGSRGFIDPALFLR